MATSLSRIQAYISPDLHQQFLEWKQERGFEKDSHAFSQLLSEYFAGVGPSGFPPSESVPGIEALISKAVDVEVGDLEEIALETVNAAINDLKSKLIADVPSVSELHKFIEEKVQERLTAKDSADHELREQLRRLEQKQDGILEEINVVVAGEKSLLSSLTVKVMALQTKLDGLSLSVRNNPPSGELPAEGLNEEGERMPYVELVKHPENQAIAYQRKKDDGEIICVYVGFRTKAIAQSWLRFFETITSKIELRQAKRLEEAKWEVKLKGLSAKQIERYADDCDFSKSYRFADGVDNKRQLIGLDDVAEFLPTELAAQAKLDGLSLSVQNNLPSSELSGELSGELPTEELNVELDQAPEVVEDKVLSGELSVTHQELSGAELAKRLDTNKSTLSRNRDKPGFSEWSQARDPEALAWEYDADSKLFRQKAKSGEPIGISKRLVSLTGKK
jgi:uncharacterized coiled-coil protein SlyX